MLPYNMPNLRLTLTLPEGHLKKKTKNSQKKQNKRIVVLNIQGIFESNLVDISVSIYIYSHPEPNPF